MKLPPSVEKSAGERALPFLKRFFANCPDSFGDNLMLKTYPKNHVLISANDACAHVYILLKGRLQAIEERTDGERYRFTELQALDIIGDYELFTRLPGRMITLTTLEPSLCLVIPAAAYLNWIRTDAGALFIRIQMLIREMSAQTRSDRQNLFLDNRTRLLNLLYNECGKQPGVFPCKIRLTHPELASRLGCSVRTVNRLISQLGAEGLVTLVRGKMQVSREQCARIAGELGA